MVAKGVLIPFHRQIFEKLRCHGYLKQYFKCYQFEWKNFTSHLTSPFCKIDVLHVNYGLIICHILTLHHPLLEEQSWFRAKI